jgi:aerobic carbon-monoxide dehydrogenase small subunit
MTDTLRSITLHVNGKTTTVEADGRLTLADLLRDELKLTGTKLGCEHGVCGSCTVLLDGELALSCLSLALTCNGASVQTIEGLDDDTIAIRLREAFNAEHALQCGFCTPGMLIAARDIIRRGRAEDEAVIRDELRGNLCRCTGYASIVRAIRRVSGG